LPLIPEVARQQPKYRLILLAIAAILWLGVLIHLAPIAWMFLTSIKPTREIFQFPPTLWPEEPTLDPYRLLFRTLSGGELTLFRYPMWRYLMNSILLAFGTVLIEVPITALAAYGVAKLMRGRSARILFLYFIGTLMIPGQVALIPRFLLISHFPWPTASVPRMPFTDMLFPSVSMVGTYWGVILPAAFNAFNFLLFTGYFATIPSEFIDAARIDGASELQIFRKIAAPLSRPIIAVCVYFTFAATWNSFIWPLIVLMGDQSKWPLSVMMYKLQFFLTNWQPSKGTLDPTMQKMVQSGVGFNALMALALIESIPVFIMFIIFREQLMKGIRLQGFK
jgi:ABC-type glycerol-3-phosphate transport system permease component